MMNKQEYIVLNDGSQYRHALAINSSTNVTVEGLTITGAGGDGVYVGRVQATGYATLSRAAISVDRSKGAARWRGSLIALARWMCTRRA